MEDWLLITILSIIALAIFFLVYVIMKLRTDFDNFKPRIVQLSNDAGVLSSSLKMYQTQINQIMADIKKYLSGI